ncbi:unnamed protein product [Phytophthora fragariaefolia]|uniref:Unnamed protein product n=1 Tax=Phytophthora fragariaefolia TaxID=1490495 RepID=A0A9W6XJD1_9STRA|nr:unnamed protein product [Phytophthora fragariaefolia]
MSELEVEEGVREGAASGRLAVVKYLAEECCAYVSATGDERCTALMLATRNGHLKVVKYLAERHHVDVSAKDNARYTPVLRAAQYGHQEIVKYLAERHHADVSVKDRNGHTMLLMAAHNGHMDMVKYLVEQHHADVNVKDENGYTALMWAARNGHLDMAQYLAEQHHADVNMKDENGYTALLRAAQHGHLGMVKYLTELHDADVNVKDKNGCTVLLWAAQIGNMDIIKYLATRHRMNVNVKNKYGHTVLLVAAQNGRMDMVKYLADQHHADVSVKDINGCTALLKAAQNGRKEIVKYLADQHLADVSVKDINGCTALLKAAQNGRKEIVKYLAEQRHVDVNASDGEGYTALMRAAEQGFVGIVRFLTVKCRADINITNRNGKTALRLAADAGYGDVRRILTPFVSFTNKSYTRDRSTVENQFERPSDLSSSCVISPSEIELTLYSQENGIGGDFRAQWLDADVVVKLFISDAANRTFEGEARFWEQLRHPNVIKMYGACEVGPRLQFFVCEHASQGSLWEHVKRYSSNYALDYDVSIHPPAPKVWKYLHEAALGLEYLHERGIIHGNLRCSNILIGSDGKAKLSNFDLSGLVKKSIPVSVDILKGTMRWQAPEVLEGNPPSNMSDVYSLGMCILEGVTGKRPWGDFDDEMVDYFSKKWDPRPGINEYYAPYCPSSDAARIVWQMCCQNPQKRSRVSSIVAELECLALKESSGCFQPEQEPTFVFQEYECGKLKEVWINLQTRVKTSDNIEYCRIFDQLKNIYERVQVSTHPAILFDRFYEVLTDLHRLMKMSPDQARIMRLSSTRSPTSSLYAFQWRINSLLATLGIIEITKLGAGREKQRCEQTSLFVSGVSDTILLLNNLKSAEERTAFLRGLKAEIENHPMKYTPDQLETMKKTYEDITAKLDGNNLLKLVPEWFIPWYELVVDEWNCVGEGGFGSVNRVKWLGSDVVVKRVMLPGSRSANAFSAFDLSESDFCTSADPSASQAQLDVAKRSEALAMFRREVDIWFGFSHPHVVRLFGACHVGRPFFVCEFATNGTLVRYLREHPDELWSKLHEAALGVQYLHARGVVHGDLKGNNIVIGSDLKAKVTDFGLSSLANSETVVQVSGAWNWVAPECLLDDNQRPTFASDVYSLGMCVVEALRVVEAVKAGKDRHQCLPWCVVDITAMKYHASRGILPSRPATCEDREWNLVKRMCALEPKKRLKISIVVDELARLAAVKEMSPSGYTRTTLIADSVEWESVDEVIATAQQLLTQLNGGENASHEVLLRYLLLWERLEKVHRRLEVDASDDCRAAFCSLVADANATTATLRDRDNSLVVFAQKTMRYYALDRALRKLCDAYFIVVDNSDIDPAVEKSKNHSPEND